MLTAAPQTQPHNPGVITLTLPRLHAAQLEVKQGGARFSVIDAGRRFGKDVLLMDLAVDPLLRGFPVGWFNPTYKMLTEVWRSMRSILAPITARVDSQEHRLELITGGVLDMWSLDAGDSARGRKYKRVIVNEAAISPNLQDAWENVIRPMLTDYRGDAYFASTPKGRNYFYQLYQRGATGERDWASYTFPTSDNPHISGDEIEAARRELPETVFAQEYLARFLEDGGAVFRRVRSSVGAYPQGWPTPPYAGNFIGGIDWGREADYTDITIIDPQTSRVVDRDRYNRIDWALQRARVKAMHERWGGQISWIAEANSMGLTNIEALVAEDIPVVPFTTTNASKGQIIERLVAALENGAITLPPDEVLLGELEAYEQERLPGGMMRYGAPSGLHDDSVISCALAWHGAGQGVGFSVI